MAQQLTCDMCAEMPADVMISNIHNGDTAAVCAMCLAAMGRELSETADAPPPADQADDQSGEPDPPVPDEGPAPVPLAALIGDPGEPDPPPTP